MPRPLSSVSRPGYRIPDTRDLGPDTRDRRPVATGTPVDPVVRMSHCPFRSRSSGGHRIHFRYHRIIHISYIASNRSPQKMTIQVAAVSMVPNGRITCPKEADR